MSIFFGLLSVALLITGTVAITLGLEEIAERRKQEKQEREERQRQEEELALKTMAKEIAAELYEKIKQGE